MTYDLLHCIHHISKIRNFENILLSNIDQLYYSVKSSNNMNWNPEAVVEMINQFVFNLIDCRDLKRSVRLN